MKSIYLLILVAFLSGVSFAQQNVDKAMDLINNKDYQKALNIANDYLSHDSTDQAIKILISITTADTANKGAFESLGDAYRKMGVLELALDNYNKAEKLDSLNVKLKFKIGQVLEKQDSYTPAANKFLQIISIDSTYAPAYLQVGEILYYAKQFPNAAFYLNKYIQLKKDNYMAFLYEANSFYNMNNFANAAKSAEEGLKYFPDKNDLKRLAALSLIQVRKYDDALNYFSQIPDSIFSAKEYAHVGRALQTARQDSIAIIFMQKALSMDSTMSDLDENIANMYMTDGKYDLAVPYYAKKIDLDSTSVSSHVNEALCLIQLKSYDSARVALLAAIKLKNDYMPALTWLARDYRLMDSTEAATDVYKNIISLTQGKEDQFKSELAESYGFFAYKDLVKKRYKEAVVDVKQALKYAPDNSQYVLWLAQSYALSGNKTEAVKEYKQVLKLDPGNADAKKGLKILGY